MNTPIDRQGDLNLNERRFDAPRYEGAEQLEALKSQATYLTNVVASSALENAFERRRNSWLQ
jgi:hypothetical protein